MPRGRGRGRGRGGNGRQMTARRINSLFKGRKLNPPQDPPSLTERPWNSAVLAIQTVGPQVLYPKTISPIFLEQLGLAELKQFKISFELRCYTMRTWLLEEKTPLTVGFFSVSNGPVALYELSDFGAINRYARVGYEWSQDEKNITYQFLTDGSKGPEVIAKITCAEKAPCLTYLQVLWRSAEGVPYTLGQRMTDLMQTTHDFETIEIKN